MFDVVANYNLLVRFHFIVVDFIIFICSRREEKEQIEKPTWRSLILLICIQRKSNFDAAVITLLTYYKTLSATHC